MRRTWLAFARKVGCTQAHIQQLAAIRLTQATSTKAGNRKFIRSRSLCRPDGYPEPAVRAVCCSTICAGAGEWPVLRVRSWTTCCVTGSCACLLTGRSQVTAEAACTLAPAPLAGRCRHGAADDESLEVCSASAVTILRSS